MYSTLNYYEMKNALQIIRLIFRKKFKIIIIVRSQFLVPLKDTVSYREC